ncbi:MAG: hypothetical protein AAF288_03105 [Planctomycetota bacterium]
MANAGTQPGTRPSSHLSEPVEGFELSAGSYESALAAAYVTLKERGFAVGRNDHRMGRVTSSPQESPIVLDVWSKVEQEEDLAWRSTLGRLRRVARVRVDPADGSSGPAERYRLSVVVDIERYDPALRRINGSSRRGFVEMSALPEEWEARGVTAGDWRPVGRDVHLEGELLALIRGRLDG